MESDDDPILVFFTGGRDSEGRTLDQILGWDDSELEYCHDYIQWLFPNDSPSMFNPDAPLVSPKDVTAFANRPPLRAQLLRALERMLSFYGLVLKTEAERLTIERGSNWSQRSNNWLTRGNHNHLRLTRILIALRLLGLREHSTALFNFLVALANDEEGNSISTTTLSHWRNAVQP